ncbi:EF-hand domain-containing protein [Phenylobacterium conjunctum]|uniref:EF-hand domain-containing protein n=1 Tax=Phenylobacterium conjunctum TaxID=1298959 RepID=A0ABW3T4J8_9CAUL
MKRLVLSAMFLVCASAAQAQMGPQPGMGPPPDPDAKHDGKVTFAEFKALGLKRMMAPDANHDGKVTQAEMQAMRPGPGGPPPQAKVPKGDGAGGPSHRMFARVDRNKDGALTRDELENALKHRFDKSDANHDGWLSKAEMAGLRQMRRGPA